MDDFLSRATAEEAVAIGGKLEAVERLVEGDVRYSLAREKIDDAELVRAVAAVQNGCETPARMHRDINRKIAQLDLSPGGPEGPLVGQEHRAIGLFSGQERCGSGMWSLRGYGLGARERSTACGHYQRNQCEGEHPHKCAAALRGKPDRASD